MILSFLGMADPMNVLQAYLARPLLNSYIVMYNRPGQHKGQIRDLRQCGALAMTFLTSGETDYKH